MKHFSVKKMIGLMLLAGLIAGGIYLWINQNNSNNFLAEKVAIQPSNLSEWGEYRLDKLDVSIKYPLRVLVNDYYVPNGDNPTVPVKVIENGEILAFTRDINDDTSARTPYYSPAYLDDKTYPYEVYIAKVTNESELRNFIARTYGKNCLPGPESGYIDRLNVVSFTIEGGNDCPSLYPVGDVVVWNKAKQVVVGYQSGWIGHFTKPYVVNKTEDNSYQIILDSGLSQVR